MARTSPSLPSALRGTRGDIALACGVVVLGLISMRWGVGQLLGARRPADATYLPLMLAIAAPVGIRRVSPLLALLTVDVAMGLAWSVFDFPVGLEYVAFPIVIYSVAAHGSHSAQAVGGALLLAQTAAFAVAASRVYGWSEVVRINTLVSYTVVAFGPFLVGIDVRRRRTQSAQLQEANVRLERLAAVEAAHAAATERARMARDLHDVVAHHLSGMVIQARAGGRSFDRAPQEARSALAHIQDEGSKALNEMRRIVGILRADDVADHHPQPRLDHLPALIGDVRTQGTPVEFSVEGEPRPVSDAVDVSAFRIVQEALTNARRHGDKGPVQVVIRYLPDRVEAVVGNPCATAHVRAGGNGLRGMRERAELCGGTVDVGPRDGGWLVHANLPTPR